MTQWDTASNRRQQQDKGARRWSGGREGKICHYYERDKCISPPEPWRLLCSIHQQAWGEKLNKFSI